MAYIVIFFLRDLICFSSLLPSSYLHLFRLRLPLDLFWLAPIHLESLLFIFRFRRLGSFLSECRVGWRLAGITCCRGNCFLIMRLWSGLQLEFGFTSFELWFDSLWIRIDFLSNCLDWIASSWIDLILFGLDWFVCIDLIPQATSPKTDHEYFGCLVSLQGLNFLKQPSP